HQAHRAGSGDDRRSCIARRENTERMGARSIATRCCCRLSNSDGDAHLYRTRRHSNAADEHARTAVARRQVRAGTAHHLVSASPNHQGREGSGTPRQTQPEQGEVVMATVQRWGRNESLIWPPRTYLYTLSAFFLSLAATGLFVYVHFQFGFSPLERYYLPYYLRSEIPSLTHDASAYQLLYVSDGNSRARPALAADVRSGQTAQPTGAPLPLALSAQARQ